jgi:hypothetical protein
LSGTGTSSTITFAAGTYTAGTTYAFSNTLTTASSFFVQGFYNVSAAAYYIEGVWATNTPPWVIHAQVIPVTTTTTPAQIVVFYYAIS